jgi:iron(III) transport system substrate-binding protein
MLLKSSVGLHVLALALVIAACTPAAQPAPTTAPAAAKPTEAPKPAARPTEAAKPAAPAAKPTEAAKPAAAPTTAAKPAAPVPTTAAKPVAGAAAKPDPAREAQLVAAARSEGEVVVWVFNFHDADTVLAPFKAKYPFLKVTVFESRGPELLAKLGEETRAGRFTADVLVMSSEMINAYEQGFLQEYEFPYAQDWPQQPNHNFYRLMDGSPWVAIYNTNTVPASDLPRSEEEFFDPKYSKYKFLLSTSGDDTPLYWAAMYGGGDRLDWEKSESYWTRLIQTYKPDAKPGFTGTIQELAAGEYDFMPSATLSSTLRLRAQGAPVGIVPLPQAPTNANGAIALAKGAPHPNAAKLYIDHFTQPDGLKLWVEHQYYIPVPGGTYQEGVKVVKETNDLGLKFVTVNQSLINSENLKRSSDFWFKTLGVTPQ